MGRLINVSIVKAKQLHGDYETVGAEWLLNTERAKGVTVESGGDTYIRYAGATQRMVQEYELALGVSMGTWNTYVNGSMSTTALVLTTTKKNGKDYAATITLPWNQIIMGRVLANANTIWVEDANGRIDEFVVAEAIADIAAYKGGKPQALSVAIAGTTTVGQVLTGSFTFYSPAGIGVGTSTYKWYRADDAKGTNEVAIAGATATTYTLDIVDAIKYIRFGVTPVDAKSNAGDEAFSAYTAAITGL